MTFINQRQYLELKHRDELRRLRTVSAQDFKDKSDRTLTISRERLENDGSKGFRHVFFLNGELILHVYEITADGVFTTRTWRSGDFRAGEAEPTIRRGPSVTDYEFATVMENLHMPILFYVPESDFGHEELIEDNFYGLTKPSWEQAF